MHLADEIFFRLAAQVDWESLGRSVLVDLCKRNNFDPPAFSAEPFYQTVAERNAMDPDAALKLLRRSLSENVYDCAEIAKDFRVAMFWICLAQL